MAVVSWLVEELVGELVGWLVDQDAGWLWLVALMAKMLVGCG